MKAQIILWDWKEQPPISAICSAVKRIKGAKLWTVDEGGDTNVLIISAHKAAAAKVYNQVWGQNNPVTVKEIRAWQDEA